LKIWLGKCEVKCIRRDANRLSHVPAIQVDDVGVGALQVLHLVIPILAGRAVAVYEIVLPPQGGAGEYPNHAFVFGTEPSHPDLLPNKPDISGAFDLTFGCLRA
jgi:hypothetical protein